MPLARQKAALASLPTLVELGSAFLRMRRTQAKGGSNSMAAVVFTSGEVTPPEAGPEAGPGPEPEPEAVGVMIVS